jgi:hypothetical protein
MHDLALLADDGLCRGLLTLVARDRSITAALLAHIAEFDARQLYLVAAYPSMFAYCVGHLKLSDEAAYTRIHVARTMRRFPMLFTALEDGRLNLTTVRRLSAHFTDANVAELIELATHLKTLEIDELIARKFPSPEPLRLDEGLSALGPAREPESQPSAGGQLVLKQVGPPPVLPERLKPIAPQRCGLQVTISGETHDKLRRAQDLLSHAVPDRDVAAVLDRALDALITQLEKRKFAVTERPRQPKPAPRAIRAEEVKH